MDLDVLDLRPLSRGSEQTICKIFVEEEVDGLMQWRIWVRLGAVCFRERERTGVTTIFAYLPEGVTDEEHDSAKIFSIDVVGLRFERLDYSRSFFTAHIKPHPGHDPGFRVPVPGFDPLHEAETCTYCEKHHPMVEYLPEENVVLYEVLRGRRIEIRIGPPQA